MRSLILIGAAVVCAAAMNLPAKAQDYPWCAEYTGPEMGGVTNCGFSTYRQCMEDVSGVGGFCERNNTYHRRRHR